MFNNQLSLQFRVNALLTLEFITSCLYLELSQSALMFFISEKNNIRNFIRIYFLFSPDYFRLQRKS